MIVLHRTTLTSSHLQAAILTPAGSPALALAGQILILTMAQDLEQALRQGLQQALLLEMRMDNRREDEDGLAEIAGSEAIAGEILITLIHKDTVMEEGKS